MSVDSEKNLVNKKESGGYSYSEQYSITYKWEINEITSFLNCAKSINYETSISSPSFSTGAQVGDMWHLNIEIPSNNNTSIANIRLASEKYELIQTKCSLYFLNDKGEKIKINLEGCNHWWYQVFRQSTAYGYSVSTEQLLEKKDEFFPDDILKVGVDLIVYDNYINTTNLSPLQGSKRKLSDDFKDLFVAKKKCDVILKIGDKTFEAHKIILMARSVVFDAMFSHDMKENKENEVDIPDVDPEVFEKVMNYIYTDQVDGLEDFSEQLLDAAAKYQLQGLREDCESFLSGKISDKNAVKILLLADRYSAKRLEESAVEFIAANSEKFKNSEEFRALENSHPGFFLAIMKKRFGVNV